MQTVKEVEGWMYDDKGDNLGKPSKKNDDMVEGLYRLMLLNTVWYDIEEDEDDYYEAPKVNSATGY